MKKYIKIFLFVLLIFILILSFLLRFRFFLGNDLLLLLDQSRDLLLVNNIIETHKIPLIGARSGLGGVFHGPLWLFMVIPFFLLAKGEPFLTLVPLFLLVSIAVVVVGFFIGRNLYSTKFGLLLAFILAVCPTLVNIVPYTTNAQVMPLIYLAFIFAILKFLRGNTNYLILSLFLIGIGIHFEAAFAVMLFPLTFFALILRGKFPTLKVFILSAVAFILPISTYIIFELRHKFLMTSSILNLILGKTEPIKGYEKYLNLQFRVGDRLIALKDSFLNSFYSFDVLFTALLIVIIVLAVYVFINDFKKKKTDKEFLFLILTPVIIFTLYIFYPQPLWVHYILPISISSIFLIVLSFEKIKKLKNGKIVIAIFIIVTVIFSVKNLSDVYTNTKPYYADSDGSYVNQNMVVDYVFKDAGSNAFGYFVYNPQILTYNMDYLFTWNGKINNNTNFSNKKSKINYLIMYPAPIGDSKAHAFWKKNVIRTKGDVIESKAFPGNIVVEKILIMEKEPDVDPNYYQGLIFR